MVDLNALTRRFLLGEGREKPTIRSYVDALSGVIESIRPRSIKETRRLSIAKEHLREIKLMTRRLEEKVLMLEEHVKVLEEGK